MHVEHTGDQIIQKTKLLMPYTLPSYGFPLKNQLHMLKCPEHIICNYICICNLLRKLKIINRLDSDKVDLNLSWLPLNSFQVLL